MKHLLTALTTALIALSPLTTTASDYSIYTAYNYDLLNCSYSIPFTDAINVKCDGISITEQPEFNQTTLGFYTDGVGYLDVVYNPKNGVVDRVLVPVYLPDDMEVNMLEAEGTCSLIGKTTTCKIKAINGGSFSYINLKVTTVN